MPRPRSPGARRGLLVGLASLIGSLMAAPLSAQGRPEYVTTLSLDSLLSVPVSAAAKYEQRASQAPASVTVITAADIARYGHRTLDQVLAAERGFYISYDRNYTYLGTRGFSRPTDYNNRILLLVNGHPANEVVYGCFGLGTDLGIGLDAIERIEIVRGPGSALYGSNAMFAVINLVTKTGREISGIQTTAEVGSLGNLGVEMLAGTRRAGGVDLFATAALHHREGADLYFPEFDDPATNHGIATNLDWDRGYGVLGMLTYGDLVVQARSTARRKGIPTASFDSHFNDPRTETLDAWNYVEAKLSRALAPDKRLVVRGSYNSYFYRGNYPDELSEYDATDAHWLSTEARLVWDIGAAHRLTLGGEYVHSLRADYRQWNPETRHFDGNFPFYAASLYLQDEFQLTSRLALTGGLRFDAFEGHETTATPRLGAVLNPLRGSTLKLLHGEAFRVPNVYEANYSGYDFRANPSLRRERIHTSELVWEQRFTSWLHTSASAYSYHVHDLIDTVLDPADSMLVYTNRETVAANGLELQADTRLRNGVIGRLSYSRQWTRDDRGEAITNSPLHLAKLNLAAPVTSFLNAAAEVRYEAERLTVYETTTPDYVLTNLNLTTTPFQGISASLLVRNLFDVRYATPGGYEHRQEAIVQDGRTLSLRLRYAF